MFTSISDALFGSIRGGYGSGMGSTVAGPTKDQEETRTFAPITDYSTEQEHAAARAERARAEGATLLSRAGQSDATAVHPSGSPQALADAAATASGLHDEDTMRKRFTPEGWRDVARRGMVYTNSLYADAQRLREAGDERGYVEKKREADRAGRQSYNAQLLSEDIASADTPEAIALSNAIGVIHDPNAPARVNLNEAARDPSLTFTPEEQQAKLGKNLPVPTERSFDLSDPRDVAIPMAAGLPLFAAGDALVAGAAKAGATALGGEGLLARGLGALAAHAPEEDAALTGMTGLEGVKARMGALVSGTPGRMARGTLQGQVPGAVIAAREAQQHGEDVTPAVVSSLLGNAVMGGVAEGVLPLASGAVHETRNLLTTGLQNMAVEAAQENSPRLARTLYRLSEDAFAHDDPRALAAPRRADTAPAQPVAREIAAPVEQARVEAGKLPLADQTPEGQHATIAKALEQVLAQKEDAPTFGSDVGMIERDPRYLDPRVTPEEPNPPLRSAADVARERAGIEPERPSDQVDAVRQMERQQREEARVAEEQRAAEAQTRIEHAAATRASEEHGPLTLAQTLERAGREREAGEPLAADYHKAIGDVASLEARVQDAGENAGAKLKLDYERAKATLNDVRRKYGTTLGKAGGAAVLALAAANSNLTDDERKMLGVAGVGIAATTGVVRVIPEELRSAALKAIGDGDAGPRQNWLEHFAVNGVHFGEHYSSIDRALHEAAMAHGGPDAEIPAETVRAIFEQSQAPIPGKFVSRLGRAVELVQGKAWDAPRPAGDWIGKLKGLGSFSKTEFALIEPMLKEAQDAKTKLSRADVLAMVDRTVPQIDRQTLMHPDVAETSVRGDAEAGNADDITDIGDLSAEDGREELQQQIDNREAAITHIESEIESETDRLADEMSSAEGTVQQRHRELRDGLREYFGNHVSEDVLDPGLDYLRDHVEGEYVPRGAVDTAFERIVENGDFPSSLDEPEDPEGQGLTVEGDDEDGWTVTDDRSGREYTGATREEALIAAEHAGDYTSGSDSQMFPKGYRVEEVQVPGEDSPRFEVLDSDGRRLYRGEAGQSRAEMMEDAYRDRFDAPDFEEGFSRLKGDLQDYADALAEYSRAENEHYWASEGERFEEELRQIETHRDEIAQINEMMADAPETRAALAQPEAQAQLANPDAITEEPPVDPALVPVRPKVIGQAALRLVSAHRWRDELPRAAQRVAEQPRRSVHGWALVRRRPTS
jgi:hypothetical protein